MSRFFAYNEDSGRSIPVFPFNLSTSKKQFIIVCENCKSRDWNSINGCPHCKKQGIENTKGDFMTEEEYNEYHANQG